MGFMARKVAGIIQKSDSSQDVDMLPITIFSGTLREARLRLPAEPASSDERPGNTPSNMDDALTWRPARPGLGGDRGRPPCRRLVPDRACLGARLQPPTDKRPMAAAALGGLWGGIMCLAWELTITAPRLGRAAFGRQHLGPEAGLVAKEVARTIVVLADHVELRRRAGLRPDFSQFGGRINNG
mmetsp:Transcript_38731/g.109530  ORF Transcript_38731/g.109530 Transcript_38731/m.109530 type:complete len:184 (+) Transcript_38731:1664-2215(+)